MSKRMNMETPVNFINPKLHPKINCSIPAVDNYEVSNLVSEDFLTRSRGFLAYSTVKPPVEVDFITICDVNIHYIVIGTVIGTQRSTGIEIFIKKKTQFLSIGHANVTADGVIFCNKRLYSANNLPHNIPQNYIITYFKSSNFGVTSDTVRLRIFRTEKSVPCLSKFEIWGKVSKLCSNVTLQTVSHLISNRNTVHSSSKTPLELPTQDFKIPDEFLDSLTFEIMSIPVTLPSGNTVDESTLEKFIAVEASQGRQPSDPFTGQKFTERQKPIFNGSLKSRIDMFLLENAHKKETYSLKRTLGAPNYLKRQIENNIIEKDELSVNKKAKCDDKKDNLQSSGDMLEKLIEKTMNNENFIRFTTDLEERQYNHEIKCRSCNMKDVVYEIPCNHLYCRICILDMCKTLFCKICKRKFRQCDIKKYNCKDNKNIWNF
ncbi:RING finger protein 37 [Agrilus planipennis]|uniref:RING finger protein 37 n=1 Tax=Agrilus planipennis TaxID=224129 RepID=A0A1W4WI59_AGRPL|nr:RING finger protein 37 [Agrilus planipennis]